MKLRLLTLVGLWLTATLAACDNRPVEVSFAQPFPANGISSTGFAPDDQGQYLAVGDTTRTLLVGYQHLMERRFETWQINGSTLDSLGLPHRSGSARTRNGRLYQVCMLATDSFRLRWQRLDTLAELGPGHPTQLRRYRGKYYLSTPADSGRWVVERLAVAGSWLSWQEFNPDSLRIRALYQETIRLQRANRRLFFILNPRLGRATHQVDSYAGLWLLKGGYGRKK